MAEEQLKKMNLFGQELIVKSAGTATGGVGGNGMAITGGGYVGPEGGITSTNRWLRFDFNDPNHRSLVILGGTSFTIGENIVTIDETTSYNLSDYISEEGTDYYVFINADGRVIANTIRTPAEGYMFIGQFHTLCNGVPANTTGIIPCNSSTVGTKVILQNYFKERDLDFYNFYVKTIDAITTHTDYNVGVVLHPLQGFNTGDILPESVWCLNFHPNCRNWDGMLYCCSCNIAIDIYVGSGYWENVESVYGAVMNYTRESNAYFMPSHVGKRLLSPTEFNICASGSNEKTSCSVMTNVIGGHVDTSGRRMTSFIGCEEMCGFAWTTCDQIQAANDDVWRGYDGVDAFGLSNDVYYVTQMGCNYDTQTHSYEGSRCIGISIGSWSTQTYGTRFCSDMVII